MRAETGLACWPTALCPGCVRPTKKRAAQNGYEPGFVMIPERETVTNCFVAEDVDAAWDEIGKYLLHDALAYSEWNPDNTVSANITTAKTVDELRASSRTHVILSVEEADRARRRR